MNWTIFVLAILAVFCNVVMDEIHTHYSRFFAKAIPTGCQDWWDPSLSWENKYISRSRILTFIFSTALVWLTDAWHFFKTGFLICLFLIILLLENGDLKAWQYGIELIFIGICWGALWELINGIIGAASDKLKDKTP